MADEADIANDTMARQIAVTLDAHRGYTLPVGEAGECDLCGEWSGRLIAGACAPCRDRYRIDAV
jgi:hypothetical protein